MIDSADILEDMTLHKPSKKYAGELGYLENKGG